MPDDNNRNVLDELTIDGVQTLFAKRSAENVRQNWPTVQSALKTAGFAGNRVVIAYALATIKVEVGNFSPRSEQSSNASKDGDRAFGAYDKVALKKDGSPLIRFDADHHLRLTTSSAGNKPHVGGTWLDPNVSGENAWRSRKGLPPREVEEANDGERYRGRGYVQLTGRANYAAADDALHLGLIDNPDRAGESAAAAQILMWYIGQRRNRIQQYLGGKTKNYLEARALVNGKNKDGTVNGLDEFTKAYDAADALIEAILQPKGLP